MPSARAHDLRLENEADVIVTGEQGAKGSDQEYAVLF